MEDVRLQLFSPEAGVLELSIAGEVDMRTVPPIRAAAERAVCSGDYRLIVFDLQEVTFIDSSGLHVLAESSRAMAAAGGAVEVRCSSPHVLEVVRLLRLDRLFTITSRRPSQPVAASA